MATLSAMFRLYDRYSTTVKQIITNTDKAAKTILGASRNTDDFNGALRNTDAAASKASTGIGKLIGTIGSLAAAKKTMDLTDTYTNTAARLAMVNDGLQTQVQLQEKVIAAANRARGNYSDMADSVAKLNLLTEKGTFSSNDESIAFAELLQKSLKVSGAGQAEQSSAFLQLTQAMAAGKLQGDEFRSIMENAPMVANAIASYMGKPKGELKELSSQGAITADIIKNAMFSAADDINGKFEAMPMTFGDAWNRIKNEGIRAFGAVFERLNGMLNSNRGQAALQGLTNGIHVAAGAIMLLINGASWFYNIISENWGMIEPIVMALAGAFLAYNVVLGITNGLLGLSALAEGVHTVAMAATSGATFLATVKQYGFNAALLACPLTWMVLGLMAVVAALYTGVAMFNHFSGASLSATGIICGALNVVKEFFVNLLITGWNMSQGLVSAFGALAYNIAAAFGNSIRNVQICFYNLLSTALSVISQIAAQLSKLPFVEFDASGLASAADAYAAKAKATAEGKAEYKDIGKVFDDVSGRKNKYGAFQDGWVKDAFSAGSKFGSGLVDKATSFLGNLSGGGAASDFTSFGGGGGIPYGSAGNPASVKGTGKGGAVKVENEEDIEWMRKLAERDYAARIAQNTLAPNIKVEFTGPITKEADVDGVAARMAEELAEIIASSPEGVY